MPIRTLVCGCNYSKPETVVNMTEVIRWSLVIVLY